MNKTFEFNVDVPVQTADATQPPSFYTDEHESICILYATVAGDNKLKLDFKGYISRYEYIFNGCFRMHIKSIGIKNIGNGRRQLA